MLAESRLRSVPFLILPHRGNVSKSNGSPHKNNSAIWQTVSGIINKHFRTLMCTLVFLLLSLSFTLETASAKLIYNLV